MNSSLYLIPCPIAENALHTLSPEVLTAVQQCQVFFVENERSARRFLKKLWRDMVIDDYSWFVIQDEAATAHFRAQAASGKTIGIISDAGCPGVADPGQDLIALAQEMQLTIHPLVGPSSILLALMASGLNGQQFQFHGYLPIQEQDRQKALKKLEADAVKSGATQIFIETPYRNNALIQTMTRVLDSHTRLCIAVDLSAPTEYVRTRKIGEWRKEEVNVHKRTAIFLINK